MKIIEALKKVKSNSARLEQLGALVKLNASRLSNTTSPYALPTAQVTAWVDEYTSLVNESEDLTHRIHKTNLSVLATIEVGGQHVTQTIDRWIFRRQHGVRLMTALYLQMTDNNLKEGIQPATVAGESAVLITIVRAFVPSVRDTQRAYLVQEPFQISSALEILNAITDLVD